MISIPWTNELALSYCLDSGMVKTIIGYAPICLSIVKVTMRASHKVFMEVDDNISLIWVSARDFRLATQASPNALFKYF